MLAFGYSRAKYTVGEMLLSQIGWLLLVTGIAYSILQSTSIGKSSSPISRDLTLISQVSPFILLTFCFVTDVKSLDWFSDSEGRPSIVLQNIRSLE